MNTKQLQNAVSEYQSGTVKPEEINLPAPDSNTQTVDPYTSYLQSIVNIPFRQGTYRDYSDEAFASGFGSSRYDSDFLPGQDIEDSRAKAQPGIAKVGAGMLKGGVRAATTAVNTVVGTAAGLLSGIIDPFIDTDDDGKNGIMESFDAATNNWVSTQLIKLQDAMENIAPNYKTAEERTEEYQKQFLRPSHMFSANAIGDFLSNFGFTVGGILGGAATSKLIGKAMSKKLANDIMKGVAVGTIDAKSAEELTRVSEALRSGNIVGVDAQKLTDNIQNVAKRINNAEARLQLYGATIGAIGEGSAEGIMAKNEFLDDFGSKAKDNFLSKYNNIPLELLAEGDGRFVEYRGVKTPDGEVVSVPGLTKNGQIELERREKEAVDEYRALMAEANVQGDRLASVTQILNLPILLLTNTMNYGRILSGGWKTSRANVGRVSGKSKYLRPGETAQYAARGSVAGKTILGTLRTMASEGAEEMAQGYISSGTANVAEERLSSFNDAGYDSNAISAFSRNYFRALNQGGVDYLGDAKNWQEGFVGAITGLLGIPGKRWGGGAIGEYQQAKENMNVAREAANTLNKLVNDTDFRSRWEGYIRHLKYDDDLSNAVADDDQYSWHTADDAQLISDVVSFADAGRINDLYDMINFYSNVTPEKAKELKSLIAGSNQDNSSTSSTANLTDKDVADRIKKQAERIKTAVDTYKNLYDSLASIAPQDSSSEYIKEMVATAMQIKAFDDRFMKMLNETLEYVDTAALSLGSVDEDGNIRALDEAIKKGEEILRSYERNIAGMLIPVKLPGVFAKEQNKVLDEIEKEIKNDVEALKKVQDMRKLSEARKAFYNKFATLRTDNGHKRFEEEKVDQPKIDDAAEQASAQIETNNLGTLRDIKSSYFGRPSAERDRFVNSLRKIKDSNKEASAFIDIYDKYADFVRYYNEHIPDLSNHPAINQLMLKSLAEDIFQKAESVDDIEALPDSIFQNYDTFKTNNTDPFTKLPPTVEMYEEAKNIIRGMMNSFLGLDTATGSRKELAKPEPAASSAAPSTNPEGKDAAQTGSIAEQPKVTSEQKEKRTTRKKKQEEKKQEEKKKAEAEFSASAVKTIPIEKIDEIFQDVQNRKYSNVGSKELKTALYEATSVYGPYDQLYVDKLIAAAEKEKGNALADAILAAVVEKKETASESGNGAANEVSTGSVSEDIENTAVTNHDAKTVDTDTVASVPLEDAEAVSAESEKSRNKRLYYRSSVPEIDSAEAGKHREARRSGNTEEMKKANLNDFVVAHPEYKEVWDALHDRGAFEYVATKLKVGTKDNPTKIKFIIDPTFPTYNGNPQVLVAVEVDGRNQVLSVLSQKNSDYYGLKELRKAILDEYKTFMSDTANSNKVFEFSKQSTLWGKRDGVVEYDYSGNERSIKNIPSYSDNAPIIFINGEGVPVFARGKNSSLSIPSSFANITANRGDTADGTDRRGHMYYLVDSGSGNSIPIRLNVEHFNENTFEKDSPIFNKIRDIISRIESIVSSTDNTNVAEQGKTLVNAVKELAKILDIHDVDFVLRDWGGDIGVALAVNTREKDETSKDGYRTVPEKSRMFRPFQATRGSIVEFIASLDKSLNIVYSKKEKSINNLSELIESGEITSNATRLRAKGVDFYFNAYDPAAKEFRKVEPIRSQTEDNVPDTVIPLSDDAQGINNAEDIESIDIKSVAQPDADEISDTDAVNGPVVSSEETESNAAAAEEEHMAEIYNDSNPAGSMSSLDFYELPESIVSGLEKHGYDEDEWNAMSPMEKSQVLKCLGV